MDLAQPSRRNHTRRHRNSGRPDGQLWDGLGSGGSNDKNGKGRKIRYATDRRIKKRSKHLQLLARMLSVPTVVASIFEGLERRHFLGARWLNTILGNEKWPAWNPYRDPTRLAYPLPVHRLRVRCRERLPFPRRPRPDPVQMERHRDLLTRVEWVITPGMADTLLPKCQNTEADILDRGVEFYRCRQTDKIRGLDITGMDRVMEHREDITADYLVQVFQDHHRHFVCSECVHVLSEFYDWTKWEAERIWVWCRDCSIHRRSLPYHTCDCARFRSRPEDRHCLGTWSGVEQEPNTDNSNNEQNSNKPIDKGNGQDFNKDNNGSNGKFADPVKSQEPSQSPIEHHHDHDGGGTNKVVDADRVVNWMCQPCRSYLCQQIRTRQEAFADAEMDRFSLVTPNGHGPVMAINELAPTLRNFCRRTCGRHYAQILHTWSDVPDAQVRTEIWRQCTVCDGFVPGGLFGPVGLMNSTTCI